MAARLSDADRTALFAMWAFRARGEHETAAHYADLGRRLRANGVASAVTERVLAASADEIRHRNLCTEMATSLHHARLEFEPAKLPRIAPHELTGRARLAYEMVALFCVTESINATLLLRSWQHATEGSTRAALHTLLADEVEHSQIGWAYLASEPNWHSAIASRLPLMLAAATHQREGGEPFLAQTPPPTGSTERVAHGLLAQATLRAVFLEAMHEVVLPGLELCGIATDEARRWLTACTRGW